MVFATKCFHRFVTNHSNFLYCLLLFFSSFIKLFCCFQPRLCALTHDKLCEHIIFICGQLQLNSTGIAQLERQQIFIESKHCWLWLVNVLSFVSPVDHKLFTTKIHFSFEAHQIQQIQLESSNFVFDKFPNVLINYMRYVDMDSLNGRFFVSFSIFHIQYYSGVSSTDTLK